VAPFSTYVIAIVMFAVGALIAFALITAIDHFDGDDAERPRH
jgi:hypothetical protein